MELKKLYLEGKEKIKANGMECSGPEASLMLTKITGRVRSEIYSNPSILINREEVKNFRLMIGRRIQGEPLSYITGEKEFFSRNFIVDQHVLIPRPETEILVERVIDSIPSRSGFKVVDLGTGSGCICVTLCLERPSIEVFATDISYNAIKIAKHNAINHNVENRILFANTDLVSCLKPGSVDLLVSNPPYISDSDYDHLEYEVKNYEPRSALLAGVDGLGLIRKVISGGGYILKEGGCCYIEVAYNHADIVCGLFENAGYDNIKTFCDLSGKERIVSAKWKK